MRSRISVVAALVGVLLLAGCGEDEGQAPLDESTMDGLASSLEPNTPTPDEATEEERFDPAKETAKQFIKRWIRLGNEMQVTGETADFLAISDDGCVSCRQFADRISGIYDNGGWVKTKGEKATSITHDAGDQWTVAVEVSPTEYLESEGAKVSTSPASEVSYVVFISRGEDGQWMVTDYSGMPS